MSSVLVTGVSGFIGSNLAEELLADGHFVRGIDNFETGRLENIKELKKHADFELVEGDIRNKKTANSIMDGIDFLFHQAAVPSVPRSIEDPILTTEGNCVGTANVLWFANECGVHKAVVASSSSVYGASERLPKEESMPPNPMSPYALSKFWTERLAVQFDEFYGLDTVALRYFNVFGPNQNPNGEYAAVIPKFINQILENKRPTVFGDGEQTRDFTFIENVVEANKLAIQSNCSGEVLNIGCNDSYSLNELIEYLSDIMGIETQPKYLDPRPGDVRHSFASIDKAQSMIGYEPIVDFHEGLEKTVDYLQSKRQYSE